MSTYEISKSSLLSLKVEILKKQEEINKSKLENKSFIPASTSHSKKGPKLAKNKGVEERGGKDYEEDPDLLKKSRQMLESKSKLYDKLSNKTSNFEENKHYLVNFNKKSAKNSNSNRTCPNFDDDPDDIDNHLNVSHENTPENTESYNDGDVDSDDEWTEYTDALGRTRTCLKKDLNYMKNKDQRIIGEQRSVVDNEAKRESEMRRDEGKKNADNIEAFNEKSELLSNDMKRELLRQQWAKEEAVLAHKDNVHYQNVLFDEARTHGVGYFAFSKDETERAKQQAELEKLRRETTQKQKEAQDLKKSREHILKNRIRAAHNRKRARLGLPPIESDEETDKPEDKEAANSVEEKELTEEEKERELMRQQHVRPWDIGKEGVEARKEHYIYSQEEWVMKKREERIDEFAPPKIDELTNRRSDKYNKKRLYDCEFSAKNNKKLRRNTKDGGATINPYKTTINNVTKSSDSDSSSSDNDDRLMQSYKKSQNEENTFAEKISFKVSQKTPHTSIISPSSSFASKHIDGSISSISPDSVDNTPITSVSSSNPANSDLTSNIPPTLPAPSFKPSPIVDELLYSPTQSSDESSSDKDDDSADSSYAQEKLLQDYSSSVPQSIGANKQKYAQIAPPPTFDYYGPGASIKRRGVGQKSGDNMADSIMMGLKYLREQAETKGKLNREDDDLMG